jgi:DNA-directed RNA polymerase subunit RPC12/RpoP
MVVDIPTKNDFFSSADHMVNEAWEKIAVLAHNYYEIERKNLFYEDSEHFTDEDILCLDDYWNFARPKLISALTLVLQSVEFRLKGLIAGISPYLLLSSSARQIPKADEKGVISFTQFHSIDAQDLIKVYETFSEKKLSVKFKKWYEEIRILRNKFMHTVDLSSDISPELIFKSIVYAHNELNNDEFHWIVHRYQYKADHSHGGIAFGKNDTPGLIFEMLQVHYELTGAISMCSRELANELFDFDKEDDSYHCKHCVSVMSRYEWFDSKHIDYCIGTMQKQKRSGKYKCVFCRNEYNTIPESPFDDV